MSTPLDKLRKPDVRLCFSKKVSARYEEQLKGASNVLACSVAFSPIVSYLQRVLLHTIQFNHLLMNAIVAFYRTSVGKKIVMSLSGLFLCVFLIVHVGGNLLLFVEDGGELFNAYSHFMGTNPIIRTIEVILFLALIAHAVSGVIVWLHNRRARPDGYEEYKLNENVKFESRTPMLTTGAAVVFFFLLIHLNTFWVPERFPVGEVTLPYDRVAAKFSDLAYSGFYLFALVFVAYHLKHGFQSAFQTLGLRHKKYIKLLEGIAVFFWLVIPLTFAAMPIYFLLKHYNCIG